MGFRDPYPPTAEVSSSLASGMGVGERGNQKIMSSHLTGPEELCRTEPHRQLMERPIFFSK